VIIPVCFCDEMKMPFQNIYVAFIAQHPFRSRNTTTETDDQRRNRAKKASCGEEENTGQSQTETSRQGESQSKGKGQPETTASGSSESKRSANLGTYLRTTGQSGEDHQGTKVISSQKKCVGNYEMPHPEESANGCMEHLHRSEHPDPQMSLLFEDDDLHDGLSSRACDE
jgi:hypothetical protein